MGEMVQCPKCARCYALQEGMAGRQVRCAGCGEVFQIAAHPQAPTIPTVSAQPSASAPASSAGVGLSAMLDDALGADPAPAGPTVPLGGPLVGPLRRREMDNRVWGISAAVVAVVVLAALGLTAFWPRAKDLGVAPESLPAAAPIAEAYPGVISPKDVPADVAGPEVTGAAFARLPRAQQVAQFVRRHGADSVVAVVLEGVPPDKATIVRHKLVPVGGRWESFTSEEFGRWVCYVAPVADVDVYAKAVDLGQYTIDAEKRVLLVKIDPAKVVFRPPEPVAFTPRPPTPPQAGPASSAKVLPPPREPRWKTQLGRPAPPKSILLYVEWVNADVVPQVVQYVREKHPELTVSEEKALGWGATATMVCSPVEDLQGFGEKLGLGPVTGVDVQEATVRVRLDLEVVKRTAGEKVAARFGLKPAVPPDEPPPKGVAAGKLTKANWQSAKRIAPDQPAPRWSVTPDAPPPSDLPGTLRPVRLAGRWKGPDNPARLVLLPTPGQAVVDYEVVRKNRDAGSRWEQVDLVKGEWLKAYHLADTVHPIDAHPSGKSLLAVAAGTAGGEQVQAWRLGDEQAEFVIGWEPGAPEQRPGVGPPGYPGGYPGGLPPGFPGKPPAGYGPSKQGATVLWGAWIDKTRVLTHTSDDHLVLWDAAKAKALYAIPTFMGSRGALSPGRKYVAAITDRGLEVFVAATGRLAGRLDFLAAGASLAFSPDGRLLAALSGAWKGDRLTVWDMTTGDMTLDAPLPFMLGQRRLLWTSADHVLLDSQYLADVRKGIVLWDYRLEFRSKYAIGRLGNWFCCVAAGKGPDDEYLATTQLPDDVARSATASLNVDEILAIRPGTPVSLDIQIDADPATRREIEDALLARLQKSGLRVAPGQPLKFVARTLLGKTYNTTYSGSFGQKETRVQVTDKVSVLELVGTGPALWHAQWVSEAPRSIKIDEGRSVQDAVQGQHQFDLKFFLRTGVPTHVPRPDAKPACGTSTLTVSGL